jgi:hypothetical protein
MSSRPKDAAAPLPRVLVSQISRDGHPSRMVESEIHDLPRVSASRFPKLSLLAGWLHVQRPVEATDNALADTDNVGDFSTTFTTFSRSCLLIAYYKLK